MISASERARFLTAWLRPSGRSTLVSDVVLRDGSTVRIRPVRPSDETAVEDYLIGLSPETRRLRFWSEAIDVRALARKIVDVDFENHLTLLVLHGGDDGRMIGGVQYVHPPGGRVRRGELLGHRRAAGPGGSARS